MRNFFVAAFLITFLLVVTSAIPKQKKTTNKGNKCNKLSESCSSRRKCCKGLECAPKGYTTGKRCIEKQSSPSSNEDDAEITARNDFQTTFTGLFDALRDKAAIIKPSMFRGQFANALGNFDSIGGDLYSKAESCGFVFNGNMNVMMAVKNATGATSEAAEITPTNIGLVIAGVGAAAAVLKDMSAEATWLDDARKGVSSFMGCDASAIATSKAKFEASVTAAINSVDLD